MLRALSLVAAQALMSSTVVQPVRVPAIVALAPSVESLHRTGEERFEAGDYAGARSAWVDAYRQVEGSEDTWPYRTTLLSLIVTATLDEFEAEGDRQPVQDVAAMLDEALAAPLDEELRDILSAERERLDPYLTPPPSPQTAETPEDIEPIEQPQQEDHQRRVPNAVWIGGGATVLAGGLAAVIAGSRFKPRAISTVNDAGDSTSEPPGSVFIEDERKKGVGWMAAGGVLAAVGTTALVFGIVRLVRDRK